MGRQSAAGGNLPKGWAAGSIQQYTPEQLDLFRRNFSHVGPDSSLSQLASGSEAGFAPIEQRAWKDFQEFQGQNASRFSQLAPGAMSARKGSGFNNFQSQSASDFALSLSAQRQELQRQALKDLLGLSDTLLGQRPYENFRYKKQQKPSFFSKLLGIGLPAAGAAVGGAFGGPAGSYVGGQLGSSLASGFNGSEQNQSQWQPIQF